eukprot:1743502-Pleurochrysis_carterae.AAC.4
MGVRTNVKYHTERFGSSNALNGEISDYRASFKSVARAAGLSQRIIAHGRAVGGVQVDRGASPHLAAQLGAGGPEGTPHEATPHLEADALPTNGKFALCIEIHHPAQGRLRSP